MQSPIFRAGPLSVGDMLDWAVRIYRARFGKLILTTAIFLVPVGILSGIISGQTMTSYLNIFLAALQNPGTLPDENVFSEFQGNSTLLTLSYLLMPFSIAANGLVTLALARQTMAAIHQQDLGVWESVRLTLGRFWAWVGMTLTMYAAYIGVAIVLVIILFFVLFAFAVAGGLIAFSGFGQDSEPGFIAFAGMMVALLCLYVGGLVTMFAPFIYLSTRWAVAMPALVDQKLGPIEALGESWKLTKGHVRRSIGYVVLIYLFYGVIYTALMTLAVSASAFALTSSTLASAAIFGVTGALLPVLWQPLAVAAYVMLYYDLRMRNQGYDLELRIEQLEAEVARAAYA